MENSRRFILVVNVLYINSSYSTGITIINATISNFTRIHIEGTAENKVRVRCVTAQCLRSKE